MSNNTAGWKAPLWMKLHFQKEAGLPLPSLQKLRPFHIIHLFSWLPFAVVCLMEQINALEDGCSSIDMYMHLVAEIFSCTLDGEKAFEDFEEF